MMEIPTVAPATIPDGKEAAPALQDSHSSTIDPNPILHITPAPAAATFYPGIKADEEEEPAAVELTEDEVLRVELLQGEIKKIRKGGDPDQISKLEELALEFNQTLQPPFSIERVRDIIEQERSESLAGEKRNIIVTDRYLGEITEKAIDALKIWNNPPKIFERGGEIVRITEDESGRPVIQKADEYVIRRCMEESANWLRERKTQAGLFYFPVFPPLDVVRNLIAAPTLPVPALAGTIEIPTIRADGSIITAPGYDAATGLYYAPDPQLKIPNIPKNPNQQEIDQAVELLQEIFIDFPFVDDASRANTIATLITPILRPMIHGPVPLALFDKPAAGTGSSLLAEVVAIIVTGRDANMMAAPVREEEWEKKLASILIEGRSVVVLDNVDIVLRNAALALLLTSSIYSGRLLGKNQNVTIPHRTVWMATGVNIQLGGDMPRRCYKCRMDPDNPRPWQRTGFKHPELKIWVTEKRGDIIAAVLTLCRSWVRTRGPVPPDIPVIGSFEAWSKVIGGILQHAGIAGFLGNLDEMWDDADSEGEEWEAFFERWFELWQDEPRTVSSIVEYLRNVDIHNTIEHQFQSVLPESVAESWSRPVSFTRKLGNELKHRNGRVFNSGLKLKKGGKKSHQAVTWIVKKAKP